MTNIDPEAVIDRLMTALESIRQYAVEPTADPMHAVVEMQAIADAAIKTAGVYRPDPPPKGGRARLKIVR